MAVEISRACAVFDDPAVAVRVVMSPVAPWIIPFLLRTELTASMKWTVDLGNGVS